MKNIFCYLYYKCFDNIKSNNTVPVGEVIYAHFLPLTNTPTIHNLNEEIKIISTRYSNV